MDDHMTDHVTDEAGPSTSTDLAASCSQDLESDDKDINIVVETTGEWSKF